MRKHNIWSDVVVFLQKLKAQQELQSDIRDLRQHGLTDEEIEGFLEMFGSNYETETTNE